MADDPNLQIPVDQQIRRKLRAERLRTGIGSRALMAERRDIPDGLIASHVSRWANGIIKTAPAEHVEYVLKLWAALSDDEGRVDKSGKPISRPGGVIRKTAKTG